MIKVENLSFGYNDNEVLKGISFEAVPSELLCILGPNGVGKSTLFKCILGILEGYDGSVTVDGVDASKLKPIERAKLMAYIPQASKPAFSYSVMNMVLMGTTANVTGFRSPGKEEYKIADEALRRLGIEHLAKRQYSKISGGEQQLVLIARAIAQGAKILIMDEPTSSLDYGNQMRVQLCLKQLAAEGYTIIQSTHNPEQTYLFADRIVCIKDGSIYSQGKPSDVMTEKMIEDLYGVEVTMVASKDDRARFFELKQNAESR